LLSSNNATVLTDELNAPSAYPVILELLLPLPEETPAGLYPDGHVFEFKKLDHRILVLHAARVGRDKDPTTCLTVVPLSFENLQGPDGAPLPLASPDPLNMKAPFPVMDENQAK
jgi:hypothetical protein